MMVDNFTFFLVIKPTSTIDTATFQNGGEISGLSGQKYILLPDQGTESYKAPGISGLGVSVGTNGVGVYEHSDNHFPNIAYYQGSLLQVKPVVLEINVKNRIPFIYINGINVTGKNGDEVAISDVSRDSEALDSSTEHPTVFSPTKIGGGVSGGLRESGFNGDLGEIIAFNKSINAQERAEVTRLLKEKWKIENVLF